MKSRDACGNGWGKGIHICAQREGVGSVQGLIAVEKNLSMLVDILESEGYDVVDLDDAAMESVDAIVVSGADHNLMDMQDAFTSVPVIDASGKDAAAILDELQKL